ncbi:MAG: helix-turn-helix domain-containing protein [Bacteroidota bacterium]
MRLAWLREHRMFLRFLLSYLLVLVVPIAIISGAIQGRILAELEMEVRRSNQILLRQVSQVMDLRMREFTLMAGQMSLNSRVRDFLFRPGSGPEEVIRLLDLQKEISIFQAPNRFLSELYIYSFKAHVMVSRGTCYDPSFFYHQVRRPESATYDEWLKEMRGEYSNGHLTAAAYLVLDNGLSYSRNFITYMQSLPANAGQSSGTLVAYLANEQIEQLLEPLVSGRDGVAFIADGEGNILISTDRVPPDFWRGRAGKGDERLILDGEPAIASIEKSTIADWYYVAVVPARIFNAKVAAIRALMAIILILCLFVGVGFAAGLSWRNYRPIKAMLEVLAPIKVRGRSASQDEIALIVESTKEAMRENQSLRSYLQQNKAFMKSNLLRRLLYGRVPVNEIAIILRALNTSPEARYTVAVADLEMPDEQATAAAKGFMSLAAAEGIQRLVSCLITEIEDERLGILLALPTEGDANKIVLDMARRIQEHLREEYHIPISVGFSIASDAEGIPQAFREAVQAVDYRIVQGHCAIIPYGQIAQVDNSYCYPLDRERQLINHVKAADFIAVSAMVDEIYEENFVRRQLPISLIRCLFFDLIGTALKVLNELNMAEEEVLGANSEMNRWLKQSATAVEMRDSLKQIYRRICDWIAGHRQEGNNAKLRKEVLALLEDGCSDPNLSLVLLAERTGFSLSYLSRFIKDQTGYSFTDYVNRLRIERSKALLGERGRTIGEVASAVGYLSANTFIRIFKKYEGITPGQFRGRIQA